MTAWASGVLGEHFFFAHVCFVVTIQYLSWLPLRDTSIIVVCNIASFFGKVHEVIYLEVCSTC